METISDTDKYKYRTKNINWRILLAIICVLAIGFYSGYKYKEMGIKHREEASKIDFYVCVEGKRVRAVYYDNFNEISIVLDGDRMLTLFHTLSVDGMRYSNTDESIIFWVKGNNARVEENGEITYSECILGSDRPSVE
jgi:membrane-bound inhibitor of C-type lysozyme